MPNYSRYPHRPSPEELEALLAIMEHGTIVAAARVLYVTPHAVDSRLDSLRRKSRLRYLPQIIGWAVRNGWLDDMVKDGTRDVAKIV